MKSEDELRWESPVTFSIAHNWTCTCHDGGPMEYGIVIKPRNIPWEDFGVAPVLMIYSEDLDELLKLIAQHLDPHTKVPVARKRPDRRPGKSSNRIRFTMKRNRSRQSLDEYNLQVAGRGVDDKLPANREDLEDCISQVSELKQRENNL